MDDVYVTVEEFLEIFSVDPNTAGARDFVALVEFYSVQLLFPELEVNKRLLVKMMLKKQKISPLVFWSRMKRALLPILSADCETLRALGCPLPDSRTCPDLVDSLAHALAGHVEEQHRERYREVAQYVQRMCME